MLQRNSPFTLTKGKRIIFCMAMFSVGSVVYLYFYNILPTQRTTHIQPLPRHAKHKLGAYFLPIEISQFNSGGIPCVAVEIQQHTLPLKLDLGCSDSIYLTSNTLNKIENKTYQQLKKYYGFRGKEYQRKIYDIPRINIGNMTFWNPSVSEESQEFQKDSIILKEGRECASEDVGRIGWDLFQNTNLFLDLKHSKIAFCDSVQTLQKEGYPTESWIRTPLVLTHHMLQIQLDTPKGPIRCLLDTGSSWNLLNMQNDQSKTIEQYAWGKDHCISIREVEIGGQNVGPLQFHQIPIRLPIEIDAILGMEFFNEYFAFLDFDENYAYFGKKSELGPVMNPMM